jgi:hypothetical protein
MAPSAALTQALARQSRFVPPYCPNTACLHHPLSRSQTGPRLELRLGLGLALLPQSELESKSKAPVEGSATRFWSHHGWRKTRVFPYRVRCFRCRLCLKRFSRSSFQLTCALKRPKLATRRIFELFTTGCSLREIGRRLQCSEHLVRIRLARLSQWALLRHTQLCERLELDEPVAYDGLENFAHSQYEPNHINQLVGRHSLFIYDFGFCPLNRKGRMSPRQKTRLRQLEKEHGRFDPQAVRINTRQVLSRALARLRGKGLKKKTTALELHSDEHFHYRQVIHEDLGHEPIVWVPTSSKLGRTYRNRLFAVNHSDLLIRQHVAAFRRETIAFAKRHERMIERFVLFLSWKNYFRPQMVRRQKLKPQAHTHTPAMALGLTQRPMTFHRFFDLKRTPRQVPLSDEWTAFYERRRTFGRDRAGRKKRTFPSSPRGSPKQAKVAPLPRRLHFMGGQGQ